MSYFNLDLIKALIANPKTRVTDTQAKKLVSKIEELEKENEETLSAFNNALNFALDELHEDRDRIVFLTLWREGCWPELAKEFPEFKRQVMNQEEITKHIDQILYEQLVCGSGVDIKPTSTLNDFNADSLDIVELEISLEESFGIDVVSLSPEFTVQKIYDLIGFSLHTHK